MTRGSFFVEQRLRPQLDLISDEKMRRKYRDMLNQHSTLLTDYLNMHHPHPSLVHGDLWYSIPSFLYFIMKEWKCHVFELSSILDRSCDILWRQRGPDHHVQTALTLRLI